MNSKKERYKKQLLDLAQSGRFIPGIYNYCDRWCERCTMTSKCFSYNQEKEMLGEEGNPETNDINNEKFWEDMALSFQVALELLQEKAKELGIELDNLPVVEFKEPKKTQTEKLAYDYGTKMHDWLNKNREMLSEKAEQFLKIIQNEEKAVKFADAREVIQFYCFFISPKIHRAHLDLDERLSNKTDEFDLLHDNYGSAKIAVIAIDRSIEALSVLYSFLPENEDEILGFLSTLSKMKRMMLSTFPKVMEFKRPGFDE